MGQFKYGNLTVGTFELADGSVTTIKLADSAVTSPKVNDGAITNAKVALDAIDTANIVDAAIATAKLDDLSVTEGKLAALAVTTAKIDNLAVTNAKIDNLAVTNAKVDNVSADKLIAGAIAVTESIQSSNYVAGTDGWAIDGDGNAEFNDVTVRGTVAGSIITGSDISSTFFRSDAILSPFEYLTIDDADINFYDGNDTLIADMALANNHDTLLIQGDDTSGATTRESLLQLPTELAASSVPCTLTGFNGRQVEIESVGGLVEILGNNILIDADSRVTIAPTTDGEVFLTNNGTGEVALRSDGSNNHKTQIRLMTDASTADNARVRIRSANNGAYRKIEAADFVTSSDRDQKRDIADIPVGDRAAMATLRAKQFRRVDPDGDMPLEYGFIAQDLPPSIVKEADGLVFSTTALMALMWEEIRELRERVDNAN